MTEKVFMRISNTNSHIAFQLLFSAEKNICVSFACIRIGSIILVSYSYKNSIIFRGHTVCGHIISVSQCSDKEYIDIGST